MTRDFRLLLAGQALSWLGNGFQTVAIAVAVLLSGGGPGDLGLVMSSTFVALLAGSLFGGVWGDRLQPRLVMVTSDLVRLAAVGAMSVLYAVGRPPTAVLCVLVAVTAGAGSFFAPAMTALRPAVVPVEERQRANATLSLVRSLTSVLGPAAGGATVAALGASTGFAVNAASYLASVVTVLLVRTRVERLPADTGVLVEMRAGWTAIRERDWLLAGVLAAAVYHVANGVVLVLAQVVAVRELGGAQSVGLIAAAEGVGGIVGAALGLRLRPHRLLLVGWSALPLMSLWVLAYVVPGTLAAVLAGATIGYAGLIFYDVCWETAIQDRVPHQLLARVASWDAFVSFVGMPSGNLLAGPLQGWFGIDHVLLGCAAVLLVASLSPLAVVGTRTLTRAVPEPVLHPTG